MVFLFVCYIHSVKRAEPIGPNFLWHLTHDPREKPTIYFAWKKCRLSDFRKSTNFRRKSAKNLVYWRTMNIELKKQQLKTKQTCYKERVTIRPQNLVYIHYTYIYIS